MEAAKYSPVGAAPEQLEQGETWWCVWARRAVSVILLLAVAAGFAGLVYRARHSRHDIALVITTTWYFIGLLALLYCCLRNLGLVPSLDDPATAAADKRSRVRRVVWIASMTLSTVLALLVTHAMPNQALKLAVRGLAVVGMPIASYYYFIFRRKDGESCDADLGHGQPDADELTPEDRV